MMEVVVTTDATRLQSSSQTVATNKPTPSFYRPNVSPKFPTNSVRALKEITITCNSN